MNADDGAREIAERVMQRFDPHADSWATVRAAIVASCREYAAALEAENAKLKRGWDQATAHGAAREAEVRALREALQPFADCAQYIDSGYKAVEALDRIDETEIVAARAALSG